MYICPKCGARIPDDAGFCGKCGVKIVFPAAPVYEAVPIYETENRGGKAFSITALVCGILSIVSIILPLMIVFRFLGIAMGITAIVFGALGKRKAGRGMAKAGFILGIVSLGIVVFIFMTLTGADPSDAFI